MRIQSKIVNTIVNDYKLISDVILWFGSLGVIQFNSIQVISKVVAWQH